MYNYHILAMNSVNFILYSSSLYCVYVCSLQFAVEDEIMLSQ